MARSRRGATAGVSAEFKDLWIRTVDANGRCALIPTEPGLAEWNEMKGRPRNLRHADAVREAAQLSAQYRKMWRRMSGFVGNLPLILRTLREKKIPFVLIGALGIAGWTGRPRATHDVDLLVKGGRNHARAVKAIRELFPQLEVRQLPGLVAFFVPEEIESVIDVAYPHRPDNAETLRTAIWIEEKGERYRIPTLETALANKYGAMLTPTRDVVKRQQDLVDFMTMVRLSTQEGRQPIDLVRLAALGEMVWPGGGAAEILRFVEQAKAGEVPTIKPPIAGAS